MSIAKRSSSLQFAGGAQVLAQREIAGLSMIEALYPPQLRISPHAHERGNCCIAVEGDCTEQYAGKTRQYRPLSLDFLPPNHVHSLSFGAAPLRCFYFEIAQDRLNRVAEYCGRLDVSVHCHGGPLSWLFLRLYDEFVQSDSASVLAIEGIVLEMLARFSRSSADSEPAPSRWLKNAKDLLHAHFLDELKLSEIADAVGVHPVHLSRQFRRHFRTTPGNYVRQLRIEYACRELLKSEISLAEIASSAGFADQSHFARTFKNMLGMSPGVFRARLRAR